MKNIINTCNKFNDLIPYLGSLTKDDNTFLYNFNIELAKSIINDMDEHNARQIAKIILAATEWELSYFVKTKLEQDQFS